MYLSRRNNERKMSADTVPSDYDIPAWGHLAIKLPQADNADLDLRTCWLCNLIFSDSVDLKPSNLSLYNCLQLRDRWSIQSTPS